MSYTPGVIDRSAVDHKAAPAPPKAVVSPVHRSESRPENGSGPDALNNFIRSTRAWESCPVPLSRNAARVLLVLAPLNASAAVVSLGTLRGRFSCDSLLCTTATLGHNTAFVALLSSIYLVGLMALAVLTHGLSEVNGFHLAAVGVLALIGAVAASGAMMSVVTVSAIVVSLIAALSLFLLATGRFRPTTPHR